LLYDRSESEYPEPVVQRRLTAEISLKNPLTPYINTEQTVRDMDLIRHLLGDEKLNYIGYSYGTWLGAWYAGRFLGAGRHGCCWTAP
jgi:pimeloyl-ACP methyl ester carboxylesterase